MQKRQHALNEWLKALFGDSEFMVTPLAGDASFRRYFRLIQGQKTYVVMDAPPEKEQIIPFINISNALAKSGIHTPAVHAFEANQGFVLLEDLGDQLLLNALTPARADSLYKAAMSTLVKIQQCPTTDPALPAFDKPFMLQEIALFRDWFLDAWLALPLNAAEEALLENSFNWLSDELVKQPQVFIHRDYHSRNLIVTNENTPIDLGVIDFQDAMRGPFTYDLVSLLKDCYIQWPRKQIITWLGYFYQQLSTDWTLADFTRAFDLCGLQRHLKVLGIFCRLHLRDKKSAYLRDLPLTFNYVLACLESHDELQPLYRFMQDKVHGLFIEHVDVIWKKQT